MKLYFLRLVFVFSSSILSIFVNLGEAEEVSFKHGSEQLHGHFLAPVSDKMAKGVLIFVHGDGAMTYDAEGYYDIIWQQLREQGYAIFSWDKAGVGESSGNWLNQSMQDRQSEVLAAVKFIQQQYKFTPKSTGLIGFSQAGWVLPAITNKENNIGFMVGIGFASNWLEQGQYYTKTRLQLSGANAEQVNIALATNLSGTKFLDSTPSYVQYLKSAGDDPMSKERYQFVLKNYRSDAIQDYLSINIPTLLLWGEGDLNVDAQQEFNWWKLSDNKNNCVETQLILNASHGMLKANEFGSQNFGFKQWLKLMWQGPDALATDFMPTLLLWLEGHHG